jgi:hypothetical protein
MKNFKEKILGDWISNLNLPLIIYFFYIWYNLDNLDYKFGSNALYLLYPMILPVGIGLYCLFKYSKEYNISKFGPSFWIILLSFLYWTFVGSEHDYAVSVGSAQETNLHFTIFYGLMLLSLIINYLKIKNLMKSISFTFGQIPFIFIALFFLKAAMNVLKRK